MKIVNKNNIIIFAIGLFLFTSVVGLYFLKMHPSFKYKFKSHVRTILKEPKSLTFKSNLKRNDYSLHRKEAKGNGNKIVTNKNINQFVKQRELVK